ncbi:MAG: hypothetical protein Q9174_006229 [Haloplaca sp. 1 TL-2023]
MASTHPQEDATTNEQSPLGSDASEAPPDPPKTAAQAAIDALATAKMEKFPQEVILVSKSSIVSICFHPETITHIPFKQKRRKLDLLQHTYDANEMQKNAEQCATLAEMVKDMNDRLKAHACASNGDKGEGESTKVHGAEDTYLELQGELGMWSKMLEDNARVTKWGGWARAEKELEWDLGIPDELNWWQFNIT